MASFLDRVIFLPTVGGTGSFVVSSAVTGYLTPAQASAANGASYRYAAETRHVGNGTVIDWEVGTGVYTSATTTLTRVPEFSSNSNAKVNFGSPPNVMITVLAADLGPAGSTTQVQYNSSGVFGGASGITTNGTNLTLSSTSALNLGAIALVPDASNLALTCDHEIRMIDGSSGVSLYGCNHASASDRCVAFDSPGDTVNRFTIDGNGGMAWGSGSATQDLSLGRLSAGLLSTTGSHTVTGNYQVSSVRIAAYHSGTTSPNLYLGSGGNFTLTGLGNNVIVGDGMTAVTTAAGNMGLGIATLPSLTTGTGNTAIGISVAGALTGGADNVAIGTLALALATNDTDCVAIGIAALQNQNVGSFAANTAVGRFGLADVTTGLINVTIGYNSGRNIVAGNLNTCLGAGASPIADVSGNIIIASNGTIQAQFDATNWLFQGILRTNVATFILGTKTTITGGSTANVPTLTSGPVNGNPTKWLPYDDNGTTRYIPAW